MLVDGLVAYWVYQGWGNLDRRTQSYHSPLLTIMQEAEQHGEDILEVLREQIKQEIYGKADLHWHYTIPTTPPLFVMNARVDRTSLFNASEQERDAPTQIMSTQQMNELRAWIQGRSTGPLLLVSSVPILLPPVIGLAEYWAGKRFWQKSIAPLRWVGRRIARFQQKVALRLSFDHWPAYSETWQAFVGLLDESRQDILVLSGDVHFSYAIEASRTRRKKARLYQFVCTPLQNELTSRDRNLIERQSAITSLRYGGLYTHMLPLYTADKKARIAHDILFQNTIALVTIDGEKGGRYTVQQEYLGGSGKKMDVIGKTIVSAGSLELPLEKRD